MNSETDKGIIRRADQQEPGRACLNCGAWLRPNESGHFVPPSLGEEGFFTCKPKEKASA